MQTDLINKNTDLFSVDGSAPIISASELGTAQVSLGNRRMAILNEASQVQIPSSLVTKQSPINETNDSGFERKDDDEVFEATEEDGSDSDKILGMPKGVVIGLGISIVLIGGFLVYKKFIAKK